MKCTYYPGFSACPSCILPTVLHHCRPLCTELLYMPKHSLNSVRITCTTTLKITPHCNCLKWQNIFSKRRNMFSMVNLWLRSTVTRTSSIVDKLSVSRFTKGWIYLDLKRCVWTPLLLISSWASTVCDWSSIIQRCQVPPIDGSMSAKFKHVAIETRGYPKTDTSDMQHFAMSCHQTNETISQSPTKINRCDGI